MITNHSSSMTDNIDSLIQKRVVAAAKALWFLHMSDHVIS